MQEKIEVKKDSVWEDIFDGRRVTVLDVYVDRETDSLIVKYIKEQINDAIHNPIHIFTNKHREISA